MDIREWLTTDSAEILLLDNFPFQQLLHFCG